jgi:hypothetical protein
MTASVNYIANRLLEDLPFITYVNKNTHCFGSFKDITNLLIPWIIKSYNYRFMLNQKGYTSMIPITEKEKIDFLSKVLKRCFANILFSLITAKLKREDEQIQINSIIERLYSKPGHYKIVTTLREKQNSFEEMVLAIRLWLTPEEYPMEDKITKQILKFSWPNTYDKFFPHYTYELILPKPKMTTFFEKKAFVNGQDISTLNSNLILTILRQKELDIERLNSTVSKPSILKNAMAASRKELDDFLAYLEESKQNE